MIKKLSNKVKIYNSETNDEDFQELDTIEETTE